MTLTTIEASDSLTFLALAGSLDLAGAKEVETRFLELAARRKPMIVDFSKVDFLSSFGMRLLLEAYKTLAHENHTVVLLNPQSSVAKVIESAGLANLMATASHEAGARALAR